MRLEYALIRAGRLIGPGCLFIKIKNKNNKKCQASKFFKDVMKNYVNCDHKNPSFPFSVQFNWAL